MNPWDHQEVIFANDHYRLRLVAALDESCAKQLGLKPAAGNQQKLF
jgi:hypothetical protein